jgi:hypothetical protein
MPADHNLNPMVVQQQGDDAPHCVTVQLMDGRSIQHGVSSLGVSVGRLRAELELSEFASDHSEFELFTKNDEDPLRDQEIMASGTVIFLLPTNNGELKRQFFEKARLGQYSQFLDDPAAASSEWSEATDRLEECAARLAHVEPPSCKYQKVRGRFSCSLWHLLLIMFTHVAAVLALGA